MCWSAAKFHNLCPSKTIKKSRRQLLAVACHRIFILQWVPTICHKTAPRNIAPRVEREWDWLYASSCTSLTFNKRTRPPYLSHSGIEVIKLITATVTSSVLLWMPGTLNVSQLLLQLSDAYRHYLLLNTVHAASVNLKILSGERDNPERSCFVTTLLVATVISRCKPVWNGCCGRLPQCSTHALHTRSTRWSVPLLLPLPDSSAHSTSEEKLQNASLHPKPRQLSHSSLHLWHSITPRRNFCHGKPWATAEQSKHLSVRSGPF